MYRWLKKLLSPGKRNRQTYSHMSENRLNGASLDVTVDSVKTALHNSTDLVIRHFDSLDKRVALLHIDGLVDEKLISGHILRPLLHNSKPPANGYDIVSLFKRRLITISGIKTINTFERILDAILSGDSVLVIDKEDKALQISTKGWDKRAVDEPNTEVIVKGPKEGFVESIRTNTALLRRRIGHPDLVIESMELGVRTKTSINIAYIEGIVKNTLVDEVRSRLGKINTDGIQAAGYIEQFIEDAPLSLFPTMSYTERPDVTAAKLLEGRIAILVDGTPVVNIVPMLFVESFQSFDDYSFRPFYSTFIRCLRFLAFIVSLILPSVYVALASFHQELLPTSLLISVEAAQEGTPFPSYVEIIGLGIVFEVLREAGIRLPRPIGQAISIVGALVLGQAAVQAGIVGAPTVIITAITAISSFLVPSLSEVSAVLRLGLLFLSIIFGAFGLFIGCFLILIHLTSLRSFGIPYFAPLAPRFISDFKDVFVRVPYQRMTARPTSLEPVDRTRTDITSKTAPKE